MADSSRLSQSAVKVSVGKILNPNCSWWLFNRCVNVCIWFMIEKPLAISAWVCVCVWMGECWHVLWSSLSNWKIRKALHKSHPFNIYLNLTFRISTYNIVSYVFLINTWESWSITCHGEITLNLFAKRQNKDFIFSTD